ncbi:helix-turn-helix domain-containing protein [Chitinophaga varians]|uniref:helix-turn-helix domain-containing protein n=1 Tax=Chitinophaga varians TaxID=2202339 RepID=UPI00165FA3CB|nr:AraC family transcriptional regulator [Chitinophaga varians]MBC9914528.1 helix-turn-helix transcriptional regulator [Chitinophaga varians]
MEKMIKIPSQVINADTAQNSLAIDGCPLIEQCLLTAEEKGIMFLEEHVLLFVLRGSVSLTLGTRTYTVGKNEMTLLKKTTAVQYEKRGDPEDGHIYYGMMFSIKDDLIKSFLATTEKITPKGTDGETRAGVHTMTECLITFAASLSPYFHNSAEVYPGQLSLKMKEMLYHLGIGNHSIYQQLMQLYQPARIGIRHIVEEYYTSPVTITELAHLSGRSLSSFKRDFQAAYSMPPAEWMRKKRLEKAKAMLETTRLPVSDICFSLGFENMSHFSRIFKEYHGNPPSFYRH